jgi:hypothetical protein
MSARISFLAVAALTLAAFAAGAAPPQRESDWPCQQPLVPTITAAQVWDGPSLEGIGDWHDEPTVAALVQRIMPRRVSADEGKAAIDDFIHGLPADAPQRQRLVTLAFAGVLDETNHQRSTLIDRLKELGARQRGLADIVAKLTAEYDAIPANAQGADAERRADLEQRRDYSSRSFDELQRTMRYACEVPATLDARLGAYARELRAAIS